MSRGAAAMSRNNGAIKRIFIRRSVIILSLAASIALIGAGLKVAAEILLGPPFAIVVSGFTAGGGEVLPSSGGRNLIGSIGGSGIAKMEGGDFSIGTGIVGGIAPSGADINLAHAFPNPYIPSEGHSGITFSQLTSVATINIFTLSGELVKKLEKDDVSTDRLAWSPVTNVEGQPVASGIYIYIIRSGNGQTKTGKIMVIK